MSQDKGPEQIGSVIDFAAFRRRMREHLRPREEVLAWEADLARIERQGKHLGGRLSALVDWPAIQKPDRMDGDEACRVGFAWARAFMPGDPGAVVWGRAGTGKTTLCSHIINRLIGKEARVCALVSAPRLIDALHADRWHRDELIADVRHADVLVLDDMGASTWQRGWGGNLLAVLDARWQSRRRGNSSTLFTTNIKPKSLPCFGWEVKDEQDQRDWDRINSRLKAMVGRIIEYGGDDRRRPAKEQGR